MKATRNTAVKMLLNPVVQVVAPVMHQAFRRADLLNSNIPRSLLGRKYRLENTFDWRMPQVTAIPVYPQAPLPANNHAAIAAGLHSSIWRLLSSALSILSSSLRSRSRAL